MTATPSTRHIGETGKAHARRVRDGWYEKFLDLSRPGLDIGCQRDPVAPTFRRWDTMFGDPDATALEGVPDGAFWTVYASHVLEHVAAPAVALREWWRVLHAGGNLIVSVPHRDLYEKRKLLPSAWNPEHKWFFLPDDGEPPATLGLRSLIASAIPDGEVVDLCVRDEGFVDPGPTTHSRGEYSIEAIVRKGGGPRAGRKRGKGHAGA